MDKKIILRTSNEIGNQMFMYASAFAIAKKLRRKLLIDNETAFKLRQNISSYGLSNFEITSEIAPKSLKFLNFNGYLKRKILKKIDFFKIKKSFFVEIKNKEKITSFSDQIFINEFADLLFLEGHFETEKYFNDIKNEIINEFNFKDVKNYKKSHFYTQLNQVNSVAICIRQNRFSEGLGKKNNAENLTKSVNFSKEQITYINKSIKFFKSKINNPIFYLWSNDFKELDNSLFSERINKVIHSDNIGTNIDKRALDLYLISQAKHHIVIPSTFNWWGAWLSQKKDKIILRPSNSFFSVFRVNNKNFWPSNWTKIN